MRSAARPRLSLGRDGAARRAEIARADAARRGDGEATATGGAHMSWFFFSAYCLKISSIGVSFRTRSVVISPVALSRAFTVIICSSAASAILVASRGGVGSARARARSRSRTRGGTAERVADESVEA